MSVKWYQSHIGTFPNLKSNISPHIIFNIGVSWESSYFCKFTSVTTQILVSVFFHKNFYWNKYAWYLKVSKFPVCSPKVKILTFETSMAFLGFSRFKVWNLFQLSVIVKYSFWLYIISPVLYTIIYSVSTYWMVVYTNWLSKCLIGHSGFFGSIFSSSYMYSKPPWNTVC